MNKFLLLLALLISASSQAQTYTIDWYKIAGGGGTSTGGTYQVSGTIGQADASGPLSGGPMTGPGFSLTGGFWALIQVVQTAGFPDLVIVPNGANSVKLLWLDPATNTYTLQQNGNLSTNSWKTSGYTFTNGFGTNFCTITPPTGNQFFRLSKP